jgi:hypothetical protein
MSAFRVIFDSRGAEIVDPVPYEPSVRLGRPPRESLLEQMQRMIMRQKMDEQDTIRDEADMMEDQLDFEDTFDNDGLITPSPYEVSDDVPDGFSAETYRQDQKTKNSPKPEDSGTESSGLAGE